MNRQARFKDWLDLPWRSYGNVSHVEAARRLAESVIHGEKTVEIQTRDEQSPDLLFDHTVKVSRYIQVIPRRKDPCHDPH